MDVPWAVHQQLDPGMLKCASIAKNLLVWPKDCHSDSLEVSDGRVSPREALGCLLAPVRSRLLVTAVAKAHEKPVRESFACIMLGCKAACGGQLRVAALPWGCFHPSGLFFIHIRMNPTASDPLKPSKTVHGGEKRPAVQSLHAAARAESLQRALTCISWHRSSIGHRPTHPNFPWMAPGELAEAPSYTKRDFSS